MGIGISKLTHVKPESANLADEHLMNSRVERFSYEVLKAATGKFCNNNLAGKGGCGDVYKGCLHYGLPVAVKRIKKEGPQGLQEWKNELRILASFHHPNVVKLLGYCDEGVHKMLVFEFIPMASLEEILSRDCARQVVNWSKMPHPRSKKSANNQLITQVLHSLTHMI